MSDAPSYTFIQRMLEMNFVPCSKFATARSISAVLQCRCISTSQTFMFETKMDYPYYVDINVPRSSVILDKYNLWALPYETKSVTDTQQ